MPALVGRVQATPKWLENKSTMINAHRNPRRVQRQEPRRPKQKKQRKAPRRYVPTGAKRGTDYPPEWEDARKYILARDLYECWLCGKNKPGLHVHHINANKGDCSPENLIALCRKCHGVAHSSQLEADKHFALLSVSNAGRVGPTAKGRKECLAFMDPNTVRPPQPWDHLASMLEVVSHLWNTLSDNERAKLPHYRKAIGQANFVMLNRRQ